MTRNLFLALFIFSCGIRLYGQSPFVRVWDKRYGGTNDDYLTSIITTSDGGFILGGFSDSDSSGDKSQPNWGHGDYWVVKIDPLGNKQWDKRFGGTSYEGLYALEQTADNGYILGGYSYSGISGDKTQPSWGTNNHSDYWIVKIDSSGNIQWDKRFGGTDGDADFSILKTAGNGYLLGGWSISEMNGDKTQSCQGGYDFWVLKIDSLGTKLWDKRYGGSGYDQLRDMKHTLDNGYILGGFSASGNTGDKSQPSWGGYDYWVVKIDSIGNKLWDRRFGGTGDDKLYSLVPAYNGGYILGGYSSSPVSGDKTEPTWGAGTDYDYWIVKIDSAGNTVWDKDFGGTGWEDAFSNIFPTQDGGYLLPGTSYSNISGDKSENNLGLEQSWILKIDSSGNKQWDKTIFTATPHDDEDGYVISLQDKCFLAANYTKSGIGGYKSEQNRDTINLTYDYWIVKMCDSSSAQGVYFREDAPAIAVYPNPFSSEVSISVQQQNPEQVSFTIYNLFGQIIFRKKENNLSNNYTKIMDLSFLSKGIYALEILIDRERTIKKIVKE